MKLKFIIPLVCCLSYSGIATAQTIVKTIYFKNTGQVVQNPDEADFSRVTTEPDAGTTLYNITEYYKNKAVKLKGKSAMADQLVYEGTVESFYPTGQKSEVTNYQRGKKNGEYFKYYPSGKPYLHAIFQNTDRPGMSFMMMDCIDNEGKARVKDGIGYYIGYDNAFKDVVEEGPIKAALRDGAWKGTNGEGDFKLTFTEVYKDGVLVEGKSVDKDGKTYTYTKRDVYPEYLGGMQAFGSFLGDNIKYPANARANKIQGAVYLSFVVKADGSLTEFKVLRSPDQELSAEAIRVLESTPAWVPGKMFGKPVRVSYTVPIRFSLN